MTYLAPVTCYDCGGRVAHQADGNTTGTRAAAVAHCEACGHGWLITVTLTRAPGTSVSKRGRANVGVRRWE